MASLVLISPCGKKKPDAAKHLVSIHLAELNVTRLLRRSPDCVNSHRVLRIVLRTYDRTAVTPEMVAVDLGN